MSIPQEEASLAACPKAQRRDGATASRSRLLCQRAVARHEAVETTQIYLHAHLAPKEAALVKRGRVKDKAPSRYRPSDQLLEFLNAL